MPIKIVDAALAGGKTFWIGRTIPRVIADGRTVWAFGETHTTCEEIVNETKREIQRLKKFEGTIIYLVGKSRPFACMEKYLDEFDQPLKSCVDCPCNLMRKEGDVYSYPDKIESVRNNLDVKGRVLDAKTIKEWAEENELDVCSRSIMLFILSEAKANGIVMPYHFLTSAWGRVVLPPYADREINVPDVILGDEGDNLVEILQSEFVQNFELASTRTSKRAVNRHKCTKRCANCRFDYAINGRHDNWDPVDDFARQIDIFKEGVGILEGEDTFRDDIVDLNALKKNIRSVEKIYCAPKEGENPKEWLERRAKEMIESGEWQSYTAREVVYDTSVVMKDAEVEYEKVPTINFEDPVNEGYPCEDITVQILFGRENDPPRIESVREILESDKGDVLRNIIKFIRFTSTVGRANTPALILFLEENESRNIGYCRLVLSHLDLAGYRRVLDFLKSTQTLLFSGTFLDEEATKDVLLVKDDDEFNFIERSEPAPKNIYILHHNYECGSDLAEEARRDNPKVPKKLKFEHLGLLLDELARKNLNLNVLIFTSNKDESRKLTQNIRRHQDAYAVFGLRGHKFEGEQRDDSILGEKKAKSIYVTYLRDVNTRGRNLPKFDIIIVYGSGRPNFELFYALAAALSQEGFNRRVRLVDDLVDYNRKRYINQASLRHHRDSKKDRVTLLITDIHYRNIPRYLHNRITLTETYFDAREAEAKHDIARYQAKKIAEAIADILKSESERLDDIKRWVDERAGKSKKLETAREVVKRALLGNPICRDDFDVRTADMAEILKDLSALRVLEKVRESRKIFYEKGKLFHFFDEILRECKKGRRTEYEG